MLWKLRQTEFRSLYLKFKVLQRFIWCLIFTTELASWSIEEADYPQDMSLKAFWELFEIEVHDLVLDITDEDLQNRHVPE